ncbi:hypothetical protein K466DRAFT_488609 [Polyporus arcularius HHB13444]|uniref:Uncharacterized protein n=1 Tax=Polyporus arcularius HHB13444 TaxID=1314778 RepID=A0A5C3PR29_9APHY|nr:hypothetical protein K466DRAFT_488609 [Polyporus arcularius HHB13444]
MRIELTFPGKLPLKRSVVRRQFPITAAYAFTDYRSQGQTIPAVIVDIMSPPGPQKLSLFNLYVALSRSNLLDEDDRLDELDRRTKGWWEQMRLAASNSALQNARYV